MQHLCFCQNSILFFFDRGRHAGKNRRGNWDDETDGIWFLWHHQGESMRVSYVVQPQGGAVYIKFALHSTAKLKTGYCLFAFISVGLLDVPIYRYWISTNMMNSIRAAKIHREGSSWLCCGHYSHMIFKGMMKVMPLLQYSWSVYKKGLKLLLDNKPSVANLTFNWHHILYLQLLYSKTPPVASRVSCFSSDSQQPEAFHCEAAAGVWH